MKPAFKQSHRLPIAATLAFFLALFATSSFTFAAEDDILASASSRIEKHRMADLTIEIVDAEGRPIPDAEVAIHQTRHAFLFGSNIFGWGNQPTEEMREAYKDQYAAVLNFGTLGYYWSSYERVQGRPEHESREEVARWCVENDIQRKGHPLAWNHSDPWWAPEDPDVLFRLQQERIDDCVTRFEGLIDIWDVVNEATHFDRAEFARNAPRHTGMWSKYGQIGFTKSCFETARAANPDATLLINDYRTDPAYERLIEQLVDENGDPIYDVIGIQSHMHGGVWSTEKLWDVCERYSQFDVPLHFTELTILSGDLKRNRDESKPWETTPEGEAIQASEVERVYTILFSHPAVEAITWWDFADYHAWQGAPAGFLRKDMSPKPAYEVLDRLVNETWRTDVSLSTNADGTASTRAFHGDYVIEITTPDGKTTELPLTVQSGENVFQISQ